MKKIIILALLAVFTNTSNAQNAAGSAPSTADTTPVGTTNTASPEARLNKLEGAVQTLKRENESLKKQVTQMRTGVFPAKRKVSISRVGSKQVIVE